MLWCKILRRLSQRLLLQLVQQVHNSEHSAKLVLHLSRRGSKPAHQMSNEIHKRLSQRLLWHLDVVDGLVRLDHKLNRHCVWHFEWHKCWLLHHDLQPSASTQNRIEKEAFAFEEQRLQSNASLEAKGVRWWHQHYNGQHILCRIENITFCFTLLYSFPTSL